MTPASESRRTPSVGGAAVAGQFGQQDTSRWRHLLGRQGPCQPCRSLTGCFCPRPRRERSAAPRVEYARGTADTQRHRALATGVAAIEWPNGEAEPAKYWFSDLSQRTSLQRLVLIAKARWWIERTTRSSSKSWPWPLRGPQLARFSSSCQPVHRSLRLSDRRALPFPLNSVSSAGGFKHLRYPRGSSRGGLPVRPSGMCRVRLLPSAVSSPSGSSPRCPGVRAACGNSGKW